MGLPAEKPDSGWDDRGQGVEGCADWVSEHLSPQIFMMNTLHISLTHFLLTLCVHFYLATPFSIFLWLPLHMLICMLGIFCLSLSFSIFFSPWLSCLVFLWLPLALVSVCLSFSGCHHNQLFIPFTFSLCYPIIPLYRSISPSPALFYLPFLILIASWISTASYSYRSPFLPLALCSFSLFFFYPCSILPSVRIYTSSRRRQQQRRCVGGDRETRE